MGNIASLWGLNEVVGRIYGVLFFSDDPLPLGEIARRLGMSKATVSLNLPVLESLRMIRRVWKTGDRKHYFKAESDFSRIFGEIIRSVIRKEVEIIGSTTDEALERLEKIYQKASPEIREMAQNDMEKIANIANYMKVAERILELVAVASNTKEAD
jgi:DNA-binding transcriptional regulator GbsR (MarR family)